MCGGMYSSPTPSPAALGVERGGVRGRSTRVRIQQTQPVLGGQRPKLRDGCETFGMAGLGATACREDWLCLGGKQSGHGDDMGTLERAATLYAASVMLGLMGLGAGLALLGVWLVMSKEKTR
ncbi:hypothetical protein LCGC14_3044420 [marine sediment metagenome]|uniref:Uncharacterized protein n=2 Tax=marine sediment metagenome TaxID=412755 RepID=A0A0F8XBY3_9ZZZZ